MAEDYDNKTEIELKKSGNLEKASQPEPKRPWGNILDNITFSNGPGDNVYVYG